MRDLQQERQWVLRLEVFDGLNLQRRSCDFKARNFPADHKTKAFAQQFAHARARLRMPLPPASGLVEGWPDRGMLLATIQRPSPGIGVGRQQ